VPEDERTQAADHLSVLERGSVEIVGRMPWSSNGTFLVECELGDETLRAVYKPVRGERPLWDFDEGLYKREVAAFVVSEGLGWKLVPETVVRVDAPFGPGSLQRFVEADFSEHYFTLVEDRSKHDRLRTICAFDVVINSADRKSGHCLLADDGAIWAIDNGLSLHEEPKLRTVIWEFAGDAVPQSQVADLARLAGEPPGELCGLLEEGEVEAMCTRAARLARSKRLPAPDSRRHHYPWPLV